MTRLEGKIAVVTGGTTGIGLATARRLAQEGARVFITGRRQAELDAVYAVVRRTAGRIDILFANAGIAESAPLGEITEDHFDRQFAINVRGTLFTVQKALPLLSDGASIILTSSVVGSKGFAGRSVYSATKAALRSFARTWTSDLRSR